MDILIFNLDDNNKHVEVLKLCSHNHINLDFLLLSERATCIVCHVHPSPSNFSIQERTFYNTYVFPHKMTMLQVLATNFQLPTKLVGWACISREYQRVLLARHNLVKMFTPCQNTMLPPCLYAISSHWDLLTSGRNQPACHYF